MGTKLTLKLKTFEYIMYKLQEWHTTIIPKGNFISEPITKATNLAFLFVVCLASKDEDRPTMFGIFDTFTAFLDTGIIEKDIWDQYDSIPVTEQAPSHYEGVPYEMIDDAIEYLKDVRKEMVHDSEEKRIEFAKRQVVWMCGMDILGEGKTLPTEWLIQEKSVYARSPKTGIFA